MDGGWDKRKIYSNFHDPQDVEDILKIYIPNNNSDDIKIWPFSKSGQVTTKFVSKVISTGSMSNSVNSMS